MRSSGGLRPGAPDKDATMTKALVVVDNVVKRYGNDTVLDGVSLSVATGQATVIIGPSGSGKSTLLRCIARLEPIQRGRILVDGVLASAGTETPPKDGNQAPRRDLNHEVGMVFQSYNLFPHLKVIDNITLAPRRVRGMSRADAEALGMSLLKRVGLEDKRDVHPARLSGGQQQRVAIARALAMQPKVMLFDEVTSALDPELVGEVLKTMRELADAGMTMLVVTHEMGFARQVANRMVFMDAGQIVEMAPPDAFFGNPRHERTRAFLSQILKSN
jgi:ABC-type polar amino acid transport system ATPase subunit